MLAAQPRRPFLFIVGAVIALTTPAAWFAPEYVWGAFPTIDKAGSLLFYAQGVHWRITDAADPAVRLIGVHLGHLWVTAAFDLIVEPFAAMNLHALLNLCLGWYCTFLFLRAVSGDAGGALLLAFPFAMGLHVFRDINWYTIEKSGVYWLPLYAWALWRARSGGRRWAGIAAVVYAGMFVYNAYWGVLGAAMGAVALLSRERRVVTAVLASALAGLPVVAQQVRLMAGPEIATPAAFAERASLDTITLWLPMWNRLEGWRALDMLALALAVAGWRAGWRAWAVALVFGALALGPAFPPFAWLAALAPGLWRFAKPEVFFQVSWLAILAAASLTLARLDLSRKVLATIMVASWILSVRTHPVYPSFTMPLDVKLAPTWQQGLPGHATLPR